jgi:hypothetical protein
MAGEFLRAGQAEKVPALAQDRPEEGLQTDGTLQSRFLQHLPQPIARRLLSAPPLSARGQSRPHRQSAVLPGDAFGVVLLSGVGCPPVRSFSHAIIIGRD